MYYSSAGRWPLSTRAGRSGGGGTNGGARDACPGQIHGCCTYSRQPYRAPREKATAHNPLCSQTIHACHELALVWQAASDAVKKWQKLQNRGKGVGVQYSQSLLHSYLGACATIRPHVFSVLSYISSTVRNEIITNTLTWLKIGVP